MLVPHKKKLEENQNKFNSKLQENGVELQNAIWIGFAFSFNSWKWSSPAKVELILFFMHNWECCDLSVSFFLMGTYPAAWRNVTFGRECRVVNMREVFLFASFHTQWREEAIVIHVLWDVSWTPSTFIELNAMQRSHNYPNYFRH